MSAPSSEVMERVKTVVDATFTAEGWTVSYDRLLRAHGKDLADDQAIIGVHPEAERPRVGRIIQLEVPVVLQFYLGFTDEPDESIVRDPRVIAGYAGRLRDAFEPQASGDDSVWYMQLGDITYPPDPTGNITRFEARITGVGTNTAAIA